MSQTSADQLIEEQHFNERRPNEGGLGLGLGGRQKKDPGEGGARATLMNSSVVFNTMDNRPIRSSEGKGAGGGGDEGQSQFDTFPRNSGLYSSKQKQRQQKHEHEQQMSTFRPQNSPLPAANPHPSSNLLSPQPPPSISSTTSKQHSEQHNHRISSCTESTSGGSVGQRSSGDGGSGSDMEVGGEHHLNHLNHPHPHPHHHHNQLQLPLSQNSQPSPPYAKVKVMTARGLVEVEEEDEEEESHYSLIRRPDGQADELVNR